MVDRSRPRTSSRNPAIRLFYYAVALLLQDAWAAMRWALGLPRRGRAGRRLPRGFFSFHEYLDLVASRIRRLHREVLRVVQLGAGG
jgi:hypothetical protein